MIISTIFTISSQRVGNEKIYAWNLANYKKLFGVEAHKGFSIHKLLYIPEKNYLLSGGSDGVINVWKVTADRFTNLLKVELHLGPVYTLEYSSEHGCAYSGGADHYLVSWNLLYGKKAKEKIVLPCGVGSILNVGKHKLVAVGLESGKVHVYQQAIRDVG